mgnify:CR=1 FL=1
MRRNSLLVLLSMIVLLIMIGVVLYYIVALPATRHTVSIATAVPATLPALVDQQVAPSSEPVGVSLRFVYIVSILVVFVSAVLLLFRMLLKALIKDRQE